MKNIVLSELNHVAYVKLHRPEVRNAFNPEMIAELTEVFLKLNERQDLKAVVLQGEGASFCAGADLNWMQGMIHFNLDENKKDSEKLFEMFNAIRSCELPVVGYVHGAAFGGALGLLAVCDLVICEADTQFCFSEVKLGISPAVISAFILDKLNLGQVAHWMLSGQIFKNDVALQIGLIQFEGTKEECHRHLQIVLQNYIQAGSAAVRATKKMIYQLKHLTWSEQKNTVTQVIAERRVSAEGQEGLKSFLEKRQPSWRVTT